MGCPGIPLWTGMVIFSPPRLQNPSITASTDSFRKYGKSPNETKMPSGSIAEIASTPTAKEVPIPSRKCSLNTNLNSYPFKRDWIFSYSNPVTTATDSNFASTIGRTERLTIVSPPTSISNLLIAPILLDEPAASTIPQIVRSIFMALSHLIALCFW